jgi:hypothetical protein
MLVCPHCRNENAEDASVCRVCGRSLAPTEAQLRRAEVTERDDDALDVEPPKPPSAWPVIAVIALLILGGAGFGIWYALRPNPCQGKYSSALFPYCAEIPQGWTGRSMLEGEGNVDRFETTTEDAVTIVQADPIIDPNSSTAQYAQQFRSNQSERGLSPSLPGPVPIDGEQAIGWDVTAETQDGQVVRLRDVVLVRGQLAWHIRLVAAADSYERARIDFEGMLESWHWDDG